MKKFLLITALLLSTTTQADTNPNIKPTRPDSRYTAMGAEVKDNVTGLIWQRCSLGQAWNGSTCTGTATTHTWQDALTKAKALGNGYRLPNIKELQSLVEPANYNPAINTNLFPNTPSSYFWSSSPSVYSSGYAWGVYFNNGYDYYYYGKGYSNYVRAVRSAP